MPVANFARARNAEVQYGRQLRKIAAHIGHLVGGFDLDEPGMPDLIERSLRRYAEVLRPWAERVGRRMVEDVSNRDRIAWRTHAQEMGKALRQEIATAPTGAVLQEAMARQIHYITSLPLDAAERVHKLTLQGISEGTRAADVAREIARSGEVSKARAMLVARTEVSRTATLLTQARAQHVGSTAYVWRTSHDG
ncbi:MAG: phage minor head protein, partial [Janthinobacterium lividum]